jgi:hypothetical protein
MIRQMSIHFSVADIVRCLFFWNNGTNYCGFMLHMANGESWYVTNLRSLKHQFNEVTPAGQFELFKFPPPVPAINEIQPWPTVAVRVEWNPRDVNDYIKEMGGADTLFLQEKV